MKITPTRREGIAAFPCRSSRVVLAAIGCLLTVAAGVVLAHEGHAALPTKGLQIDLANGHLLLTASARDGLDVATAEVETRSVEGTLLAYAQIELPWKNHGFATSRLPGRVVKVLVAPGQTVRVGEVVAEVQSLELETLQLEALTAQTEATLGEKVLKDLRASVDAGAIAGQSLYDAELKLAQANNALVVVRSKWIALGLGAESLDGLLKRGMASPGLTLPVRVPVGGTVIHAEITVGKYVEPNEHLAEVADLSTVWVRVGLLEKDLHRAALGTAVDVRLAAYPGEVFRTTITAAAPFLDPVTHLASVWAELKNPPGKEPRFVPGMAGRADVILAADRPRPAVPAAAVIREGIDQFIFVEEANASEASEYRKKPVALGRHGQGRVEIVAGDVFPGDRVVTRGAHELGGLFAPTVLRPGPEAARAIGLRVESVASGTVDELVTLDGAVELPPASRGSANAPVAGVIASIRPDRGSAVKAGDVLAEVSSPELQSMQLDLIRTDLELRVETDLLGRIQGTAAIARRRVLESESRVATLKSQLVTLRRKLATVGLAAKDIDNILKSKQVLSALPIRSPLGGIVVSFDKAIGQAVTTQEVLFTVHDQSKPMVMGFVSERDFARVRIGQTVRTRLVSDPSALLTGKVARSGQTIGADSRSLSVWVELEGAKSPALVHGQLATLSVVTGSNALTTSVSLAAVGGEQGGKFVFVRRPDGVFDRRFVETGRADDRRVEIVRGLEAGESVAVAGVTELAAGLASLK